jgi:hypothetical protein
MEHLVKNSFVRFLDEPQKNGCHAAYACNSRQDVDPPRVRLGGQQKHRTQR